MAGLKEDVNAIKKDYPEKVVGVIGGSSVSSETEKFSESLGYRLRQEIEFLSYGYIMTGGVGGVGEAVHEGISRYVKEHPGALRRDFAVLPHGSGNGRVVPISALGNDMYERRKGIPLVAAVVCSVSGGEGTAHEIQATLDAKTPLVLFDGTGGATQSAISRFQARKERNVEIARSLDEGAEFVKKYVGR